MLNKILNYMQTPKIINAFFLSSLKFGLGVYLLFSIVSCESTVVEAKYIPDTKGVTANVELIRFEQDFFALDTTNISAEVEKLREKYPEFTMGYLTSVLGIRDSISQNIIINGYLNYEDALYTYDTVQQVFEDLSTVQAELNQLATHYSYYFPDAKPLTKAFTYLAEYHGDRLAVIDEGFVGLPLDMALGAGYPPYTFIKMPLYDQRTCNKAHLVAKAADAISQNIVGRQCKMKASFLIDMMLFNGKIFYLNDLLLPHVADSIKFGFSSEQTAYCQSTELMLYEHLSDEELLYSNQTDQISKYVNKGPFNPRLRLPANSGSWLGYRIIKSFVQHHRQALKQANPNLPARELDQQLLKMVFEENDPQKFLAKYKPPKS